MTASDLYASSHFATDKIFDLQDELNKPDADKEFLKQELSKWVEIKVLAKAKLEVEIEKLFEELKKENEIRN